MTQRVVLYVAPCQTGQCHWPGPRLVRAFLTAFLVVLSLRVSRFYYVLGDTMTLNETTSPLMLREAARSLSSEEQEAVAGIKCAIATSELACDIFVKAATGYVALHLGRPNSWFVRLIWGSGCKMLVLKLGSALALSMVSGFEIEAVPGGCRVMLNLANDLVLLRPLLLHAFELEVGKG
jgi:hypothetical protein